MSIHRRNSELKGTKAYKDQLITTQTSSRFSPFPLPKPNKQRHVLVTTVNDNRLNLYAILTQDKPSLSLGESLLNQFLCIIVYLEEKTLEISKKHELNDEQDSLLNINVDLKYNAVDAEKLVFKNEDVLKELGQLVENTLEYYFDYEEKETHYHITTLETLMQDKLYQNLLDAQNKLGLKVKKPSVSIKLEPGKPDPYDYERWRAEIHNTSNILEAMTISGRPLKTIIESIDPRLILNFYYKGWGPSIKALQIRLTEILNGKDYQMKINLLTEVDTDEMEVERIRETIVNIVSQSLSSTPGMHDVPLFPANNRLLLPHQGLLSKTGTKDNQITEPVSDHESNEDYPAQMPNNRAKSQTKRDKTPGTEGDSIIILGGSDEFGIHQEQWNRIQIVNTLLEAIKLYDTSLKIFVENIDPSLILSFYQMKWPEAMQEVDARLTQIIEGQDYVQKIKFLQEIEVDEIDIEKVRDKIVNFVKMSLDTNPGMHNISTMTSLSQFSSRKPDMLLKNTE